MIVYTASHCTNILGVNNQVHNTKNTKHLLHMPRCLPGRERDRDKETDRERETETVLTAAV